MNINVNNIMNNNMNDNMNNLLYENLSDLSQFKIDKKELTVSFKDISTNIVDIKIADIKSDKIKEYFIKQIPEYFLTIPYINLGYFLKLKDFDLTLFKIDKKNRTISYKDITVDITDIIDIQSKEIKEYCIKLMPEYFLSVYYRNIRYTLKLNDFDLNLFKIDKKHRIITYNEVVVKIKDIDSIEIKMYFMKQIPEYFLGNSYRNMGYIIQLNDLDINLFQIDHNKRTLTYKDITVDIVDIESYDIMVYCIRQIPEYFLSKTYKNSEYSLKLTDFDLNLFEIDKVKHTLKYKDIIININDIESNEIKDYCSEKICKNDKDYIKYIIDSIKCTNNKDNILISINENFYNSLKSPHNKLYILKYIFSKYHNGKNYDDNYDENYDENYDDENKYIELKNKDELFKIFAKNSSFLIDLLRQMISTKNVNNLKYILQNKNVLIHKNKYKELQSFASNLHLFEITNILTIYESLDVLCH